MVVRPFLILALPRSRTYWLSRFLSFGDWSCGHDEARHMRGLNDIKSWLSQDKTGTVETAAAPYWRMLKRYRPELKVVVIRRPVNEVVDSFASACPVDRERLTADMRRLDAKLDQIERRMPGVLSVNFADLASEGTCREIFEFCLPYKHDHAWWASLANVNLQINLPALVRYAVAHSAQLGLLASLCGQESRMQMWASQKPPDLDGMTFQEETFASLMQEAGRLFSGHALAIGERPGAIFDKNLPLLQRLDDIGALQVVTAKSNGKMFGYLLTVLAPSLEDSTLKVACQTMFYTSPDAPGIGMRMQRAAMGALKARGGRWEVVQRAGVRGSGPRLGSMYRRLGAEEYGHLFKLTLEAA